MPYDAQITQDVVTFSGITADIRLSADASAGLVTIMEMSLVPGAGAPPHRSPREDKFFRVISGQVRFRLGEVTRIMNVGDDIWAPRGVVHGFVNPTGANATLLLVAMPGGHDRFFRAMAALPVPHDGADVARVCRIHNQEIVGGMADIA